MVLSTIVSQPVALATSVAISATGNWMQSPLVIIQSVRYKPRKPANNLMANYALMEMHWLAISTAR